MFEDDVLLLVGRLAGLDEQSENFSADCEDWLYAHLDMSLERFTQVIQLVMPFTPILSSPLTKRRYHVLGVQEGELFSALVKTEAE